MYIPTRKTTRVAKHLNKMIDSPELGASMMPSGEMGLCVALWSNQAAKAAN